MRAIMMLHPNRADAGALSGGDWQIPLERMQDRIVRRVARSASLDSLGTQFDVVLDRARGIRAMVLINHNLTTQAMVRVRAWSDEAQTELVLDTGWGDAYGALFSTASLSWEDPNFWDGRPTQESLEGFTQSCIRVFPSPVFARRWRVEIDDPSNPAGFLEIGRLFMAGGWTPSQNYSYGGSLGYETDTAVQKSLSGTEFFDRREPYRVLRVGFDFMPQQEALDQGLELQRRAGIDGEVFVIPDPQDTLNITRLSFLGRFRTLSAWEQAVYLRANIAFEIKEIL